MKRTGNGDLFLGISPPSTSCSLLLFAATPCPEFQAFNSVITMSSSSNSVSLVSIKKWTTASYGGPLTLTHIGDNTNYLLNLSDEMIFFIIKTLTVEERIRLCSLHSRLRKLVEGSLSDVTAFPTNPYKRRFLDTQIYFSDYFSLILKLKNLKTLHVCHKLKSDDEDVTRDLEVMGTKLASSCPKIEKLIGRHCPLDLVHSYVTSIKSEKKENDLTEITIHRIGTAEDVTKVLAIIDSCPKLTTIRCLIHSNSLTADIRIRIREPLIERGIKVSGSGAFSR